MKGKILSALKAAHADFSAQTYDVVATNLANTGLVTDENLQDIVSKSLNSLQATQAEADRRVSKLQKENQELKTKLEAKPEEKKEEETSPENKKEDGKEPDVWEQRFNKLAELVEKQNQSIEGLYKEKQTSSRKTGYEALFTDVKDDKIKANKLAAFDRLSFKDDEDYNAFLESEKEFISGFVQSQATESLKGGRAFQGQSTGGVKPDEKLLDSVVDSFKI